MLKFFLWTIYICPSCLSVTSVHHVRLSGPSVTSVHHFGLSCLSIMSVHYICPYVCPSCLLSCLSVTSWINSLQEFNPFYVIICTCSHSKKVRTKVQIFALFVCTCSWSANNCLLSNFVCEWKPYYKCCRDRCLLSFE